MSPARKGLTGALVLCFSLVPTVTSAALPSLGIETYAGLIVTGEVNTVYSIQSNSDLADTNNWRCLALLQLSAPHQFWCDPTAPAGGTSFYRVQIDVRSNMVFIPPGNFRMGSPTNQVDRNDAEGPETEVTITRGFWIGKYEVTQAQYLQVMGINPSRFSTNNGFPHDLSRPVEMVSWVDATNYCAQRTQQEVDFGLIPANCRYRLPTEAEWEYACRALTSTRFSYGDDPVYSELTHYAWHSVNSSFTTHPVGEKLPNAWGLHDTHGNVWEWCQDWRSRELPGGRVLDPTGALSGSSRVVRGGSWANQGKDCRSSDRGNLFNPNSAFNRIGLRVVLAPD